MFAAFMMPYFNMHSSYPKTCMFNVIKLYYYYYYLAKTKPATLENVVGESPPSGLSRQWGPQRTVELWRDPEKGLGISIISGKVDSLHGGIFIKNVLADSPAGWNGTLKRGDRILEVINLLIMLVFKYNNTFVSSVAISAVTKNGTKRQKKRARVSKSRRKNTVNP